MNRPKITEITRDLEQIAEDIRIISKFVSVQDNTRDVVTTHHHMEITYDTVLGTETMRQPVSEQTYQERYKPGI